MFKYVFLALLLTPLIEIYILIQVGGIIGALPAIGLCIFTAALGTLLLRRQGIQTLQRAQARVDRGEMPAVDVIEGLLLLVAGVLLLTPGFVTDIIGFLCLIPGFRTGIATGLLIKLIRRARNRRTGHGIIIEGEFREEENKKLR